VCRYDGSREPELQVHLLNSERSFRDVVYRALTCTDRAQLRYSIVLLATGFTCADRAVIAGRIGFSHLRNFDCIARLPRLR